MAKPTDGAEAIGKRSRRKPAAGELFELSVVGVRLVAVVLQAGVDYSGATGYLVGVIDRRLSTVILGGGPADVSSDDLLLPPSIINGLGWTRGFYRLLDATDVTPHFVERWVFRKWDGTRVDVSGAPLLGDSVNDVMCGPWAIGSHNSLAEAVGAQLGL